MAILDKRPIKIYPVISVLRDFSAKNNDVCTVCGFEAIGDGGGGNFVFDYYSELPDDNSDIISPDGLEQGRWVRIYKPSGVSSGDYIRKTGDDTKAGNLTIEGNLILKPELVELAGIGRFYRFLNIHGNIVASLQTHYWNGSSFVSTYGTGFGDKALEGNKGENSNGFGYRALINNEGINSSGFGYTALEYNTGNNSNGMGRQSLEENSGHNSNGFGNLALQFNTGHNVNGVGYSSLRNNSAPNVNGFGFAALEKNKGGNASGLGHSVMQNNKGEVVNGFGNYAMQNNTGSQSNGFGFRSLENNHGNNSNAIGNLSLRYNQGDENTVIGYNSFSDFYPDSDNAKTFTPDNINVAENQITINGHGFGANGNYVNLEYSTTGTAIGISGINSFEIIDANTIKFSFGNISSQGTGTHTLTPQFIYNNVLVIGNGIQPTKSDQTLLGGRSAVMPNATITEIEAAGDKALVTKEYADKKISKTDEIQNLEGMSESDYENLTTKPDTTVYFLT